MGNIVVVLIIIVILAISVTKVVSDKRKGVKCIGCPHSKECPSKSCNPSK
ncbi:FeoB-associated Cys-rich membrane protein [Clostridium gasigenes]|uniref:FeoB-associated Cys-rich membrane protein n=1 Tax=Clostridium gasigenes TaxID=94869 RepID=A0A7X0RAU8_9CLOT|nr:FeoB-associated Cys-rich membrane protein [Clostridium gasigenes]MBB6624796.1 FeoB-associated Cys-rich membrane protein [Clostridium gasigenes]MBB6714833.1 FeoB-associated Cys-rich membrane protein [Clostridium gasigenes]MBU3089798.1 FeoB-associated Cys-rich membrane protein [Clostridium gasigenes]NKF08789.1 FeoB-associated Cys-rich membrane protein [Clostridium gasigenes]QSW19598.1 FeoB-associated Cys-rich membrane protein [Clostridium gasigenes]